MNKIKGIIVLFICVSILFTCTTLPKKETNIENDKLVVVKLNFNGVGPGLIIFTNDAGIASIQNIETKKIYRAAHIEDSFSFIPHVPIGKYILYVAEIQYLEGTGVKLMQFNIGFEVSDKEVTYIGAYIIDCNTEGDVNLKIVSKEEEKKNEDILKKIVNVKQKEKGWIYN